MADNNKNYKNLGKISPTFNGIHSTSTEYERLCIVFKAGTGYDNDNRLRSVYISMKKVPVGIELTNVNYWVSLADWDAAMAKVDNKVGQVIDTLKSWFSSQLDEPTSAIYQKIDTLVSNRVNAYMAAMKFTASATTLPAGSQATAVATYNAAAKTVALAYGIPTGATGNTGAKGDTGVQGATGAKGDTGPAGNTPTVDYDYIIEQVKAGI